MENSKKLNFHQIINLSLAVMLFFGVAATAYSVSTLKTFNADAAKGGNSGGGGGGKHGGQTPPPPPPSTETINVTLVSANPVPLGTAPTFHATGFQPNEIVYVIVNGYINVKTTNSDSTGALTYTWDPITIPGSYTFTAYDAAGNWGRVAFTVQ